MITRIEDWIDKTNQKYSLERKSCLILQDKFSGFYTSSFLGDSYFVVVDDIPKPYFPELREIGMGDFLDMPVDGITYKNTYYIREAHANNLTLHCHELVHVAQWGILGARSFISRYINEIQQYGYRSAPLEVMAYELEKHYSDGGEVFDIPEFVKKSL